MADGYKARTSLMLIPSSVFPHSGSVFANADERLTTKHRMYARILMYLLLTQFRSDASVDQWSMWCVV